MYRSLLLWATALLLCGGLLLLSECASGPETAATQAIPDIVDFRFHVKPILSDRCFKCHGPDAQKREANLRLDTKEGLYQALQDDPKQRVVVPGNPEKSELYRRVISHDPDYLMPPTESNLVINDAEREILRRWIKQGAKYQEHWAFTPPAKAKLPKIRQKDWPTNEIDHFVLATLEANGLKPNEEADWPRLIRRVCFDLTGLPPSGELLGKYLKKGPGAYDKLVDELLASTAYGERMAAHWLDVARYADSHGYQDDSYRNMWPWRDWVIHAFNENMPYDQFITWQIAGDLLPNATKEQILATGFNRNHKITQEGGVIDEEFRVEYVSDRTNTFGKALLGLTVECAKCHDHKYDPISQEEYFSLFSFFNSVEEKGFVGDVSLNMIADPPVLVISNEDVQKELPFVNKKPADTAVVMVMKELAAPRPTFVLNRGMYDQPAKPVSFGTPRAVMGFGKGFEPNRVGLAKWLFEPKNPLTARVFVNRVWQEFFGAGIVKSSADFGNQGELPSHPELLDWLAADFREHKWDIKYLVKQIVSSATYRQSAVLTEQKQQQDPDNRLLSRGPRERLSAEMLRDNWLATSGLLSHEIGGPSVKPYQPEGLWEEMNAGEGRGSLTRYKQDSGDKLFRRSLYTFWKRTVPHPFMINFDAPSRDNCSVRRIQTNTPLQALNLMNDPTMQEASRVLAATLLKKHAGKPELSLQEAFRRILSRDPEKSELSQLVQYHQAEIQELKQAPDKAGKLLQQGVTPLEKSTDKVACAALSETIQLIYNLDEALTK